MGAIDYAAIAAMKPPAGANAGWTGLTKRVWLLLYAEGGWWEAAEIGHKLGAMLGTALRDMVRYGFVEQKREATEDGPLVRYGVTSACRVPRGIEVAEIEQVLQPARAQ